MTKRLENARHRAAVPATGSLEVLSKAVASNAGSMGRQAAVIAAAGGLVVTLGVSGSTAAQQQHTTAKSDTASTTTLERTAATSVVSATATAKTVKAALPVVKVKTAPAAETTSGSATLVETTPAPQASSTATEAVSATPAKGTSAVTTAKKAPAKASSTKASTKASTTKKAAVASTAAAAADEAPSSASSGSLAGVAATAKSYLGAPYVLGGNTPAGWDCSGFVRYVYAQNGMHISARTARGIWTGGQFKKTSNPKPGDIIIQRGGAHIAIYMGGGRYIGAQNPSAGTTWRDLSTTYDSFNGYYTWVG